MQIEVLPILNNRAALEAVLLAAFNPKLARLGNSCASTIRYMNAFANLY